MWGSMQREEQRWEGLLEQDRKRDKIGSSKGRAAVEGGENNVRALYDVCVR